MEEKRTEAQPKEEQTKSQEETKESGEPKTCPSCGFKNRSGADFCGKCGRKL